MNIYKLIKLNRLIKNNFIKLIGIYSANILGIRHLSIKLDPSFSCNLSCLMCYYSSIEYRKNYKGSMTKKDIEEIARVLFPKALQVAIGCGAEPTLNDNFIYMAQQAVKYKVPNITIVTNGQLLNTDLINQIIELQIHEIVISCHGLSKNIYEKFMVNANFEKFQQVIKEIDHCKKLKNSNFPKIRINYTVNNENLEDLKNFSSVMSPYNISTLQVRPSFDLKGIYYNPISDDQYPKYLDIIAKLKIECKSKGILLLANISDIKYSKSNKESVIASSVYLYLSPNAIRKANFEWDKISYNKYMIVSGKRKFIRNAIFAPQKNENLDKSVKYEIY
jgi:MoaA/NifB/PqqE/SkfB family radical SAM enzyme